MGFFSKLFGKEKQMEPMDYGVIGADMHSHLIPGIDDGAQVMEESVDIIGALKELGFRKLITTPHIMSDYYRNTPEIILGGLEKVREAVKQAGIDIELEAAAEYYLDHDFTRKIGNEKLLTFGDNYVLFELPFLSEPQMLDEVIFNLQTSGYKPILAHVERYSYWHMNYQRYEELHDKDLILQMNLTSLTGHYSPEVKKVAERLVNDGLISIVGTDTHKLPHMQLLERASMSPSLYKLVESGKLLNTSL